MKDLFSQSRLSYLLIALFGFTLILSSCNDDEGEAPRPNEDVVEILANTDGLDSLAKLLTDPGYQGTFGNLRDQLSTGEYTIFAPNNAAFRDLLLSIGLESMADLRRDLLSNMVNYHVVVNTQQRSNELDSAIISFINEPIIIQRGDSIVLNPATQIERTVVVTPDVLSQNGVIHVINNILLPPGYARTVAPYFGTVAGLSSTVGGIQTINSLYLQANLLSTLGNPSQDYTLLMPLDQIFQNAVITESETLQGIAGRHVLPGDVDLSQLPRTVNTLNNQTLYVSNVEGTTYLNGVAAFDIDLVANNGKVVILLGVLSSPRPLAEAIEAAELVSGQSFDVFKKALAETALEVGENRTIFMPTDEAFENAGISTVLDSVSRLSPAFLTTVLQNHIHNGIVFSSDVNEGTLSTLAGSVTISFEGEDGFITISDGNPENEDAQLINPADNLVEGNVVIHVIDQVLVP
jgi:transforming growth factor-beta-induced protein